MTDDLVRRLRKVAALRFTIHHGAPTGEYPIPECVEGLSPEAVARALERVLRQQYGDVEHTTNACSVLWLCERCRAVQGFLAALAAPDKEG